MWIFDAHLLDSGWKQPRCVQVCPTGALEAVHTSDEELQVRATQQGLEVLQPELGTRPRIFYRNLQPTRCCFLGGNVCRVHADGHEENVEGAHIELSFAGEDVRRTETDCFGDFKIDGLRGGGSSYRLRIRHAEFGQVQSEGILHDSANLGPLLLPGRSA
jgi:ferredoxin